MDIGRLFTCFRIQWFFIDKTVYPVLNNTFSVFKWIGKVYAFYMMDNGIDRHEN